MGGPTDRGSGGRWALLEGIPDVEVRRVLSVAQRRKFPRGQVLFHEGDPGETLHLIDRGHVTVRVTTPMGETATVNILGPGEIVGELAVVSPGPRNATVTALQAVETLALRRDDLSRLRAEHAVVDQVLMAAMVDGVRRLTGQLLEALYVPVPKRVVRRIFECATQFDDGARPIVVPLTQEDLADLAGTARPTVNRVLQGLRQDGLIELGRARLIVADLDALRRAAR